MFGTQNETRAKAEGGRRKAEGRSPSSFILHPSAFTLVELLVVITIIGILAALITGAALNALNKAKQAAITMELENIGGAMQDLKNELGAYPPNGMIEINAPTNFFAQNDFVRMFKKAFPRNQEPPQLILALAGGPANNPVQVSGLVESGMTGAEAVYFWLGGFSSDVAFPISGPGGPSFSDAEGNNNGTLELSDEVLENRSLRYEFDLGRLVPRTDAGIFDDTKARFITYNDPRPGSGGALRRMNLWLYQPSGSTIPIVYFDSSRHTPEQYDLDISGSVGANVFALKQYREGVTAANAMSNADVRFVEDKKFQILHSGTDDIWGDFSAMYLNSTNNTAYQNLLLVPTGPFIGDIADTVGNFMSGNLEDEQE